MQTKEVFDLVSTEHIFTFLFLDYDDSLQLLFSAGQLLVTDPVDLEVNMTPPQNLTELELTIRDILDVFGKR